MKGVPLADERLIEHAMSTIQSDNTRGHYVAAARYLARWLAQQKIQGHGHDLTSLALLDADQAQGIVEQCVQTQLEERRQKKRLKGAQVDPRESEKAKVWETVVRSQMNSSFKRVRAVVSSGPSPSFFSGATREIAAYAQAGASPSELQDDASYGKPPEHEIVEADNYPSPETAPVSVAQTLAANPWLPDKHIFLFTQDIARRLSGQPNAGLLHFADSQVAEMLINGDPKQQERARKQLAGPATPPIVFVPVNNKHHHWSLLVVDRHSKQAFHYDSMFSPEDAAFATHTNQFKIASRVASELGVQTPRGMPIAKQPDTQSCGDHVLYGIEELANRAVSGQLFHDDGMDLSSIEPDREYIVDVLTRAEQRYHNEGPANKKLKQAELAPAAGPQNTTTTTEDERNAERR